MADVRAWNCDFFVCSAYKFYGPHVGVLWGRRELLERLDAPRLEAAPAQAPKRLETGTLNHEGIVGAAAAVDFLTSSRRLTRRGRERLGRVSQMLAAARRGLLRRLWEGLRAIPGVRAVRSAARREPHAHAVLHARTERDGDSDVATALAARGIFRVARRLLREHGGAGVGSMSANGLVRAGCAAYTDRGRVERPRRGRPTSGVISGHRPAARPTPPPGAPVCRRVKKISRSRGATGELRGHTLILPIFAGAVMPQEAGR